jgi:hypothetical protein
LKSQTHASIAARYRKGKEKRGSIWRRSGSYDCWDSLGSMTTDFPGTSFPSFSASSIILFLAVGEIASGFSFFS